MAARIVARYGAWRSPISSAALVEQTVKLSDVHAAGTRVFWAEGRPNEGGRTAVCSLDLGAAATAAAGTNAAPTTWTPTGFNARSLVHEYGGVSFVPHGDGLLFVNYADQQLYRQAAPTAAPERITAAGTALRFIAPVLDPVRPRALCVSEDHTPTAPASECRNAVVSVDLATGAVATLVRGADFYSHVTQHPCAPHAPALTRTAPFVCPRGPALSADGRWLAWVEWMHPSMVRTHTDSVRDDASR
jgi:hypothetical protein